MSFSSDFDSDDFYNSRNMEHLSCIRNVQLMPESSSLHSLDMLPIENGIAPGLMAVTLKTIDSQHLYNNSPRESSDSGTGVPVWSFEIRVVHGSDEIHSIIRKAVLKAQPPDKSTSTAASATATSAATASASAASQETVTNGVWAMSMKSILESEQDFLLKFSCDLLESLIRYGWEVSTSGRTTTTPGFEYVTWIFKNGTSAALNNAEIISLVISEATGSLRVVPSCPEINNVVKRAIEKLMSPKKKPHTPVVPEKPKSDDNSKSEGVGGLIKESRPDSSPLASARKQVILKDDPDCPNLFKLEKLKKKSDPGKDDRIVCSNILLEIIHLLFCRQWKIITATRLPIKDAKSNNVIEYDVLFFCRDGRILPSLGQQTFAMIELEGPNFLRFYNMPDRVLYDLRAILQSENYWPEGLVSKEAIIRAPNCREFRCRGSPWTPKRRGGGGSSRPDQPEVEDKIVHRSAIFPNQLVSQLMVVMNRNEFNLFSSVQLGPAGAEKKNHLIFKHSSVKYEESLCVHLSGQNKIVLIGGGEPEVSAIRHTLTSRWPYPISIDRALSLGRESKANTRMIWLFKVKRYPWAVSYGNKYLDRTIEWTRSLLRSRQVPIPSPQNSDSESGKSILVFLLKELMTLGWRIQTSADISSGIFNSNRNNVQPRLSDPHSIFLMR